MVLKLSFIMIVILKKGMSLIKKYLYDDLDKLFLKERHFFLLKVRPTNQQTHIDKLSIEIQRRVLNGKKIVNFDDKVNVSVLISQIIMP